MAKTFIIKIAKLNTTLSFVREDLPEASQDYGFEYGLTQSLNDVHAGISRKNYGTEELFLAAVADKVAVREAQIRSGNVPGTGKPSLAETAKVLAEENARLRAQVEAMMAAQAVTESTKKKAA